MRRTLLSLLGLAAAAAAQSTPAPWKIHHALRDHLRATLSSSTAASAGQVRVPVYFVMRDRLGYHHWFPRLNGLSAAERRAVVVRELAAHAARTQHRLLARLRDDCRRGEARAVRVNWLGNFVRAEVSCAAIDAATAVDDVWEIRLDAPPPRGACEDTAPVAFGAFPGNGPAAVGADRVWALGFRGQGVVVMNADSGINALHRALADRLWQNPGEIIGNGIDDDRNGLIDDINGWDFGGDSNSLDDNGGHGTSTAGVLVADDGCDGISYGIAPAGRVMTGKILTEADQWEAVQYAILMGADTMTSSHSYKNDFVPPPNYLMHRDIGELSLAAGLIRTNSTSNNGGACSGPFAAIARPFNVSVPGNLPPPYLDPAQTLVGRKGGVIGVGAHNLSGGLAAISPCGPAAWHLDDLLAAVPAYPLAHWDPLRHDDYPWFGGTRLGLLKPDVVAPTGTLTTIGSGPSCGIGSFGGTSNATPIVNGCIMLWKSANPRLTPEDAAMILHQTARDAGAVPGKENGWGAGRVDAYAGLLRALAVHRVDGEPAWQVVHRSGTAVRLEIDGSAGAPVLIALGLSRADVDFGAFRSGIGAIVFAAFSGSTGPGGRIAVAIPVPPVQRPFTVYSQAFVDDRAGPTRMVLASNVIGIDIVP